MGLFSFKSKKNLFEVIGLQLNSNLESKLEKTNETDSFIDYSVKIKDNFDVFNNATFRFFDKKKDLSGTSSFNIIFESKDMGLTINKIKNIVDTISKEYGKDRRGKGKWTNEDDNSITTYWEGREWIINSKGKTHTKIKKNCAQINLHFHLDEGIDFAIIGASNLVK